MNFSLIVGTQFFSDLGGGRAFFKSCMQVLNYVENAFSFSVVGIR